ncbi:MAG: sterol desaturase family protein [Schlesneria sp.]
MLAEVTRLSLILTVIAAIFVPVERLFAAHPQKIIRKQFFVDLGYYFLNSLLVAYLISVPLGILIWSIQKYIPAEFLKTMASLPIWLKLVLGLVVGETGYYWGHRMCHEIPFLWDYHSIHHSAESMDFLVNTRAHPIDMMISRLSALAPQLLLGLTGSLNQLESALVPSLVTLFGLVWGYFIHANIRWRFGLMEWVITTPAFHHWHHTLNGPINVNYAATFPWIDWVFGTIHLPKDLPVAYGVEPALPGAIIAQLVYPLSAEAPSIRRLTHSQEDLSSVRQRKDQSTQKCVNQTTSREEVVNLLNAENEVEAVR